MSRVKHAIMIVFKVVFILLCFAVASVYTALSGMDTTALDGMKGSYGVEACEVEIFDSSYREGGATLAYQIVDGKIVFDLVQGTQEAEDVYAWLNYPAFEYDTDAMRDYLRQVIGERAEREDAYLSAMEEGPWSCYYRFSMTSDQDLSGMRNIVYTVMDTFDNSATEILRSGDSPKTAEIEDFYVGKGEEISFVLVFGSDTYGPLPSGRYVFDADFGVSGLYYEDAELSFATKLDVIASTCLTALKEQGLDIFKVENWLVFYGAMVVAGMFIYLWRDLRAMKKIFCALMDGDGLFVIVHTYINGAYAGSHVDYEGAFVYAMVMLLVTVLCYMIFLLTIPVRIVIHLIRDIVYLFKEDDDIEGFSIIGNILGSVGIYALAFGIVALLGGEYLLGGICAVVGLGMCIAAHFLCKAKEY